MAEYLSRLFKCLEEFRKFEDQMPMQRAATFVAIAIHEGCTMKQLSEWLGVTISTCNRNVAALGDEHRNGGKGLGWVITKPDPAEPRRNLMFLTPNGKRVASALLAAMKSA